MSCNCNGGAPRPGAHVKSKEILHSFTFACYFSHNEASFVSTTRVRAVAEWVDLTMFDQHCLKCVKEAEKKIFPLGRFCPTWVPFMLQKELLGDNAEPGTHRLSVLCDPLTQI